MKKTWRRVPDATRERIVGLSLTGVPVTHLAARFGVSATSISVWRKAAGVARPANQKLSTEQLELAEQLLEDGCSYAEVARTVGVTPPCLMRRFPGRGWTPRQAGEHRQLLGEAVEILDLNWIPEYRSMQRYVNQTRRAE